MTRKAIITCAVTGSIHTPSMSPHLPITPEQIIEQSLNAVAAGACIIHLHVRQPADGRPSFDPNLYSEVVSRLKDRTEAIINLTTGGSSIMTLEERLAGPLRLGPEMCSVNMGSMNFGIFPLGRRQREWKYDWEAPFLEKSHSGIFKNTFADLEFIFEHIGERFGTKFEFECYDVGHLYTLAYYLDQRRVRPPLFVQTIFGILGGIGTDAENVLHMRRIADKLFGHDYQWSVLGAGRSQMKIAALGASLGSHVRVGLEDNLWLGHGRLARSNAEQVLQAREILALNQLEPASPVEARALLGMGAR